MEPTYYTVIRIDGDYAVLLSDEGIENPVARALLPMEIEEGSRLLCEMFSYRLLRRRALRSSGTEKPSPGSQPFPPVPEPL